MPNYEASGTENLRSDAKIYNGSEKDSPSGSGTDAGGTENLGAEPMTKTGSTKDTPGPNGDSRPAGLQHFDGSRV